MNDLAVARTALGRLHPDVFLEAGVHDEPLIVEHAGGRHLELLGHREDLVRLADFPALREFQRRRQVLVVALQGAPGRSTPGGYRALSWLKRRSLAKWP